MRKMFSNKSDKKKHGNSNFLTFKKGKHKAVFCISLIQSSMKLSSLCSIYSFALENVKCIQMFATIRRRYLLEAVLCCKWFSYTIARYF